MVAEGGPPRLHCRPGCPLGAEDALGGPALQYHQPLLPVGVEQHRPALGLAEGEEEGRLPAHEPR